MEAMAAAVSRLVLNGERRNQGWKIHVTSSEKAGQSKLESDNVSGRDRNIVARRHVGAEMENSLHRSWKRLKKVFQYMI